MIEVDARGLSCPEPLMMTQAAMKKNPGDTLKVLVTEPHTRTNVERYAKSQGKSVEVIEKGTEFELIIKYRPVRSSINI